MLPLVGLAGIAARIVGPTAAKAVGAQFSKTTAQDVIKSGIKNYAQGAAFNVGMSAGRRVSEFTQGAQDNPDARQSLI
jgi:hypothetical protein